MREKTGLVQGKCAAETCVRAQQSGELALQVKRWGCSASRPRRLTEAMALMPTAPRLMLLLRFRFSMHLNCGRMWDDADNSRNEISHAHTHTVHGMRLLRYLACPFVAPCPSTPHTPSPTPASLAQTPLTCMM